VADTCSAASDAADDGFGAAEESSVKPHPETMRVATVARAMRVLLVRGTDSG
jgi:hypothetical protein